MKSIGRPIGTCFALTAFAISIAAGLLAQNDAVTVLGRAIVVLLVCRVVGAMLGWVLSRVVSDAVEAMDRTAEVAVSAGVGKAIAVELDGGDAAQSVAGRRAA